MPVNKIPGSTVTYTVTDEALVAKVNELVQAGVVQARLVASTSPIANTETVVLSFTMPANSWRVGSVLQFWMTGTRTGATATTPQIRVRIGPTTLLGAVAIDQAGLATSTAGNLRVDGSVTVRTLGAAGTVSGESIGDLNQTASATVSQVAVVASVAIDTTVDNLVELTLISGAVGNAYTITSACFILFSAAP